MQILCDKYGIIVDGLGEQGIIMLVHPTATTLELGVFEQEDYSGERPLIRNINLYTSKPTFLDKCAFAYYILRWLFLSHYEQKV